MLHGWMDVGASFQFSSTRWCATGTIAPDWRGFGAAR
jgi:hypothetical protein